MWGRLGKFGLIFIILCVLHYHIHWSPKQRKIFIYLFKIFPSSVLLIINTVNKFEILNTLKGTESKM